ncbi:hypothetical protein PsorP6_003857 [Peronosclerospora sorghi]|uniref:Uncharacterized protein n=1 Tax=Peronosclerospora sorghi TaxID=230839 RepID=A0ACC0VN62_9STRA|nr:hypothetical protein PsorP6_003857 [Peronosclerospora sorghi]
MQTADNELNSLKCRYASKRCWNLRAIKRNGERHNLCEMHRQKANSNQRRLDKKRKAGQAALGLPTHFPLHAGADLERRMRMRASIALKLEQELGGLPLTTQYIRQPARAAASLAELQRAASLMALGNAHNSHLMYSSEIDSWRDSSHPSPGAWIEATYPRSPRAMLRAAAMAKMTPVSDSRDWLYRNEHTSSKASSNEMTRSILLPPIATAVARSGEGHLSSTALQRLWQPDVRRTPTLQLPLRSFVLLPAIPMVSPTSTSTSTPSPSSTPKPSTMSTLEHDASSMCRYPSKKCYNPRALKRNGERHNLCDFHRQKANKNQRRLELKRKARAQACTNTEFTLNRIQVSNKSRQRARRAPLSAHVAMKEEALVKQQVEAVSKRTNAPNSTSWSFQDLVLLDGVYDRVGFQTKEEDEREEDKGLPLAPMTSFLDLPRLLSDTVEEETLEAILQDGQVETGKSLENVISGLEALAAVPEGKTSPVDVGENWDSLDLCDYWLPADQPLVYFDALAFPGDEDGVKGASNSSAATVLSINTAGLMFIAVVGVFHRKRNRSLGMLTIHRDYRN